jgi:hypothetical protein
VCELKSHFRDGVGRKRMGNNFLWIQFHEQLNVKKIEKWFYYSFLSVNNFLEIRVDLLDVYKASVSHPDLWKKVNKNVSYWFRIAVETGKDAEYYDPHKGILKIISIIMWIVGIILGTIGYLTLNIPGILLGVTPATILKIYSWLLSRDTELVQGVNKKLNFDVRELQRIKRQGLENIFAAAVWNRSLLNPKTLSVLALLRLVKFFSSSIYENIFRLLVKFTNIYLDNNKSKKKTFLDLLKLQKKVTNDE